MNNKKTNAGRKSKKHLEALKIDLKHVDGTYDTITFRSPTFYFDKVVEGVKKLIKE